MSNVRPLMSAQSKTRAECLRALIAFPIPIDPVVVELSTFSWDASEPLATLRIADVKRILERYLHGALTAAQVTRWADLIECREDISTLEEEEKVNSIIFRLANPSLNEPLTEALARSICGELRGTARGV